MSAFSQVARQVGLKLIELEQTVSVAESSSGGLISANLLAVPGASVFYMGGSVVYTLASRRAYLDIKRDDVKDLKPLSEEMVLVFARAAREKLSSTWGLAELGAAGPSGTPYGHGPGTSVIGLSGPIEASITISTESADRESNMIAFAEGALILFDEVLNKT